MTKVKCNNCGKERTLSKENEKKLLAKNKNNISLVKKNYLCRNCKKKKREAEKAAKKKTKKKTKKK